MTIGDAVALGMKFADFEENGLDPKEILGLPFLFRIEHCFDAPP